MEGPVVKRTGTWLAALVVALLGCLLTAPSASATYPGGDGRIAFTRANQIYTVTSSGSGLRQLTTAGKNYRPQWSPDGARIAYLHETGAGAKDIWVMRADGTDKQQVTQLGDVTTSATWKPDGAVLAFANAGAGLQRVRSTAPFGNPVQLLGYFTGCNGCEFDPHTPHILIVDKYLAWSPTGSRIAIYNHYDGQVDNTIYMYNPATQEARFYAGTGAGCCGFALWGDLTWGPTGKFGYTTYDQDPESGEYLPSRITFPTFASIDHDRQAAPSPSGLYMALTNIASGGATKIYITGIHGSGRRFLTNGYQPSWQPRP